MGFPNLLNILKHSSRGYHKLDEVHLSTNFIAIDAESLLYSTVGNVENFYKNIFFYVATFYLKSVNKTDIFVLVTLDNGAPGLKKFTQTKRRNGMSKENIQEIVNFKKNVIDKKNDLDFLKSLADNFLMENGNIRLLFDFKENVGEAEHKLFLYLKSFLSNNIEIHDPIFISVDNDVFHLALMFCHDLGTKLYVYNSTYVEYILDPFEMNLHDQQLKFKLFLLGNDYLPKLISGTPDQLLELTQVNATPQEVLLNLRERKKIRYIQVSEDPEIIELYRKFLKWTIYYYRHNKEPNNVWVDERDLNEWRRHEDKTFRDTIASKWNGIVPPLEYFNFKNVITGNVKILDISKTLK